MPEKKQARLGDRPLDLTSMEYDFLELMLANKGRVLSRDYIMDRLKGYEWEAYDRSIDILVSRVRSKLGDSPADPKFIKTVRGAGYMFIG
jgi:DNA-binding response OmpR family regulator